MPKRIRKSQPSKPRQYQGSQKFEHWYVDNQVYFITARCRGKYPAFAGERAKAVFWDRFDHYTAKYQFVPWVTSLMTTHYHVLGYCRHGETIRQMMRPLHGSVAKLVNDLLPQRRVPFWSDPGHRDYFDGCIRDQTQCRRAYRYVLTQCVRHGICADWRDYAHTRVNVAMERAIGRALELGAFLTGVPYKRYMRGRGVGGSGANKPGH